MKGRSLRPKLEQMQAHKHTMVLTPQARIIKSSADATQDRFIPLDVAKRMYIEGKLTEVDLGPAFPDSYMEV